jgi:hypothetical protein
MKFKCPHWAMYMLMFTACAAAPWLRSMATSWSFAYELGRMDLSAAELERIAFRIGKRREWLDSRPGEVQHSPACRL